MSAERPLRISVVGAGAPSDREREEAERVGALVARAGAVLVCGGLGGVMEAAARGAAKAGGLTVGILPGDDPADANAWIALPLATGLGHARNALVARAGDAVIAVGGAWGTLSELAFARIAGRPTVVLGSPPAQVRGFETAATPEDAVDWAIRSVGG